MTRKVIWLPTLIVILLLGFFYRLDYLYSSNFVIDSDEAIVGLMAKHILDGKGIPTFYYGQPYMGSFEAIVAALAFKCFGISSVVLKCVPFFFSMLLIVLIFYMTLKVSADHYASLVAAMFAALPPSALLEWGLRARGGFIEILVLGALSFILLAKVIRSKRLIDWPLVALGAVLGFGWWTNNQIVYFILPAGYSLLAKALRLPRVSVREIFAAALLFMVAFLMGGLPFWIYNLQNNFESFGMLRASESEGVLQHLSGVFRQALPILLGAKRFWQEKDIFPYASVLVWSIYIILVVTYLVLRAGKLVNLLILKIERDKPLEIFALLIVAAISVFVLSSFGYLVQAPRYLLPAYVGLFALTGYAISELRERLPWLGAVCVPAILFINLSSFYYGGRAIPGEPLVFKGERVSMDQSALQNWLIERGYPFVYTNYWIGYRLAFETAERVRFLVTKEPYQHRIDEYIDAGQNYAGDIPLVLVPSQSALIESALKELGYSYERKILSGYLVLYNLTPKEQDLKLIPSSAQEPESNYNLKSAPAALDGDLKTRWGSAHPQTSDMEFRVSFREARRLRSLTYALGNWMQDYPRGLQIDLILANGERRPLFNPDKYEAIRYHINSDPKVSFYFSPVLVKQVILRETGSHSIFDWSIAELQFFE